MSAQNEIDLLRFPSGLSVRQAKADAKKIKKSEGIKLHEALRRVSALNGIDLPWEKTIEKLQQSSSGTNNLDQKLPLVSIPSLLSTNTSQNKDWPVIQLTYQNLVPTEIEWFHSLPFIAELINELQKNGRKHGVNLEIISKHEFEPEIKLFLDYSGCTQLQIDQTNNIPFLKGAISSICLANDTNTYSTRVLMGVTEKTSSPRIHSIAVQSIFDMVKPGSRDSIEKLSKIIDGSLIRLDWYEDELAERQHKLKGVDIDADTYDFAGVARNKDGYQLTFLCSGKTYKKLNLSSDEFVALCNLTRFILNDPLDKCILLPSEKYLEIAKSLSLLRSRPDIDPRRPYELSDFGREVIKACRYIWQGLKEGRAIVG